jgi:Ca-activated chloride channel family protein
VSFLWPSALLLLALVPLAVAGYVGLERRRRTRLAGLGSLGVTATSGAPHSVRGSTRRWLPAALVLAGLTTLVVAIARPQAVVGVPRQEGVVVLAFDVSASMAADDIEPSRMEAAKAAASAFVGRQPDGVIVGVVAFSDSGLSVQVPTSDQAAVLAAIARLHPERGTSVNEGLEAAVAAVLASQDGVAGYYTNRSPEPTLAPVAPASRTSAAIVLLSDGEATADRDPLVGATAAADQGIRVYAVGVGSTAGAVIDVEGFRVATQLDDATLQAIADTTGGTYQRAGSADDLAAIYEGLDARVVVRSEAMEVTALVAALGLALLVAGGAAGLAWLGRLP